MLYFFIYISKIFVYLYSNQHIRMISEDHVTLKTGAENSFLIRNKYNLQCIQIEDSCFKW